MALKTAAHATASTALKIRNDAQERALEEHKATLAQALKKWRDAHVAAEDAYRAAVAGLPGALLERDSNKAH